MSETLLAISLSLITVRKRSLRWFMFLHLYVSVHAGIHTPGQTPPGADTPGSRHSPGSRHPPCAVHAGRYGQQAGGTQPYWNAYLLVINFLIHHVSHSKNGLQPHSGATLLFSMRTVSLASSQTLTLGVNGPLMFVFVFTSKFNVGSMVT